MQKPRIFKKKVYSKSEEISKVVSSFKQQRSAILDLNSSKRVDILNIEFYLSIPLSLYICMACFKLNLDQDYNSPDSTCYLT